MPPTCPVCEHTWVQTRTKKEPKESDPRVLALIRYYASEFKALYGVEPTIKWGAAGTVAKRVIKEHNGASIDLVKEYLTCDDKFFKETGYSFLLLPNYIAKRAVLKKSEWNGML